ncbi:hypothetical protein [Diaminobutyricimonas sp. LJ205]|uniref:hypothetical protein n=1 Tax=Diaminobutyricimonas sp. LJ205 TaxID=2683590 RepID=UPI0012F4FFCB|nr:hypothetical protein [Diaminobutyricimonas sp. LJ205]
MARLFPLAGLLRLRHLQEEQAASTLAAANSRLGESSVQAARARTALGGTPTEATSTQTLYALAATRASTRSMLADLEALRTEQQAEAQRAEQAFAEARAQSIGLEKLHGRHTAAAAAEELHTEQSVIDELASVAWHREHAR